MKTLYEVRGTRTVPCRMYVQAESAHEAKNIAAGASSVLRKESGLEWIVEPHSESFTVLQAIPAMLDPPERAALYKKLERLDERDRIATMSWWALIKEWWRERKGAA